MGRGVSIYYLPIGQMAILRGCSIQQNWYKSTRVQPKNKGLIGKQKVIYLIWQKTSLFSITFFPFLKFLPALFDLLQRRTFCKQLKTKQIMQFLYCPIFSNFFPHGQKIQKIYICWKDLMWVVTRILKSVNFGCEICEH